MEYCKRKHLRLKNYDYAQNGAYFVTICTKERACTLCKVEAVGRDDPIPPYVALTPLGEIAKRTMETIPNAYPSVAVEKYVIMPNHVHLLLSFSDASDKRAESFNSGMGSSRPTLMMVIRAYKRIVTQAAKTALWQDGFYEHIIRDELDFLEHLQYIENNSAKWAEDAYYQHTLPE